MRTTGSSADQHMKTRTWNNAVTAAALGAIALCGAAMTGCRGDREDKPPRQFFPDMDDMPRWKPQSETEFFADGRTMRQPVKGTVAFGRIDYVSLRGAPGPEWAKPWMDMRDDLLKDDERLYAGVDPSRKADDPASNFLDRIPVPVSREMLARGQERFNIYCSVCHGYAGDGKGAVGQRWAGPVPSFHDPKYRDLTQKTGKDGYIFSTALHGVIGPDGAQKMPPYGHALSERDAWAVVAYVRALQESQLGKLSDVPDDQRRMLESSRPKEAAGSPGAPGGAK